MVNINKRLNSDYTLTGIAGASIEDVRENQNTFGGKLKDVANLFTFSNINNSSIIDQVQKGYRRQKQSIFGSAQLAYRKQYLPRCYRP